MKLAVTERNKIKYCCWNHNDKGEILGPGSIVDRGGCSLVTWYILTNHGLSIVVCFVRCSCRDLKMEMLQFEKVCKF